MLAAGFALMALIVAFVVAAMLYLDRRQVDPASAGKQEGVQRNLFARLWAARPRYFDQTYSRMGSRRCRWWMLGDRVLWQRWTVPA